MMLSGIELCCPFCGGMFEIKSDDWSCRSCDRSFPVIFGIPDLRTFSDPYIELEEDRKKGEELAREFDSFTLEELVRHYYSTTPVVPKHHAEQYTRGLIAAGPRAEKTIDEWNRTGSLDGPFLEIGCGTGPLLTAAARRFKTVVGVDIAFRWLVVAKKRFGEAGLNVPLICACAEALPFRENQFLTVAYDSALEVVNEQKKALAETHRVLKPGGEVFITTPNRYSLGPDPHLKIWAGGYLPDRWIAEYARRQHAIPPKRRLLSSYSIRKMLIDARFQHVKLSMPAIPNTQVPPALMKIVSLYNSVRKLPIIRSFLAAFGPLIQANARKPE